MAKKNNPGCDCCGSFATCDKCTDGLPAQIDVTIVGSTGDSCPASNCNALNDTWTLTQSLSNCLWGNGSISPTGCASVMEVVVACVAGTTAPTVRCTVQIRSAFGLLSRWSTDVVTGSTECALNCASTFSGPISFTAHTTTTFGTFCNLSGSTATIDWNP